MNKNPVNKRNVIDYLLIFVYVIMMLISNNQLFRIYSLLGVALLGICISICIIIFKKDITKQEKTREWIAVSLLVLAAGYSIYRIITLK
ncbi:MAG TPA: hypothetical protein P5535_04200 [Clostridia bacterium]|nr:hypothetical protein [Clostridia bacterium]